MTEHHITSQAGASAYVQKLLRCTLDLDDPSFTLSILHGGAFYMLRRGSYYVRYHGGWDIYI